MEKLDLANYDLSTMSDCELNSTEGGNFFVWLAEKVLEYTAEYVISGGHRNNLAKLGDYACDAAMMACH